MITSFIRYLREAALTPMVSTLQRENERAAALKACEGAIGFIESRGSSPLLDLWEQQVLTEALGAVFRGAYRYAKVCADEVIAQEKLSPLAQPDPAFARFDFGTLKKAFSKAQEEPLLDYPLFGPIRIIDPIIVGEG